MLFFSAGPISLAAIVNNTEVGSILQPFLEDPSRLEDILHLELLPQQVGAAGIVMVTAVQGSQNNVTSCTYS
jgi:hypothetical protein